jgi:hypothetical protein
VKRGYIFPAVMASIRGADHHGSLQAARGTKRSPQDDIRKAHREMVRKYHPDANLGDHSSEEHFREVQRAYEVLSDPEKRRKYDKRVNTSARRSSGQSRARAGTRTGSESTAPTADLSELLSKLTDHSSQRSNTHKVGSFQLRGEEVARLAKYLGVDMSRICELFRQHIEARARIAYPPTHRTCRDPHRKRDLVIRRKPGVEDTVGYQLAHHQPDAFELLRR